MGDETPKKSSLPKPLFMPEPKSFSTKKQRGTPPLRPPPRPQAKTCPPISRVFKRRQELFAAQSVTFLDSGESSSLTSTPFPSSAHYDSSCKASYFEQAFKIEEKIGAGCFGTVYKVRSKEDGKLYAVKIARERYRGLSDRKEKLEEVRKHQFLLPHSNCVRFFQSWEENGRLYQKFELCQKSLMDVSEEKHDLPESLIWSYLVDLLLAIQHLHDHDLIHMDIKPENIFIGMDGICKLGDFGLVIDLAKMDTSKAVEGDPRYLASEVLSNRKFTKAADIFALGVTILELATDLDLPKHGALWHQLRLTGPDPQLTKHLSQDLRLVIQLMMGNDFERRPTVKQLLDLPAVQKATQKRTRQLNFQQNLASFKATFLLPIAAFFTAIFVCLVLKPFETLKRRIEQYYDDSRLATPVQAAQNGFLAPYPPRKSAKSNGVSFSSDDDSTLASPLKMNFSDESENEEDLYSLSNPRRSKRNQIKLEPEQQPLNRLDRSVPNKMQSTPKTSAAQRFRSRYIANSTPNFSPKKRLDFDCFDGEAENSSPRKSSLFGDQNETTPNSSRLDESAANSSSATIKPVQLASKFDCFSDCD